jgi:hypothetical protein
VKDRPCAVVLVAMNRQGHEVVTVLPITHTPPSDPGDAVEIPAQTKRRLGLDNERSWIVVTEANRFVWPGPDLRPARSADMESIAYGLLPEDLFNRVREMVLQKRTRIVRRTE